MKFNFVKLVKKIFEKRIHEDDVSLKEAVAIVKNASKVKDGIYYVIGTDAAVGVRTFYKRVGWFTYTVEKKVALFDDFKNYNPKLLALIYADKRIDLKDELKLASVETILAENAKAAKAEQDTRDAEKAELARVKRELEAKIKAEKQAKLEAELKAELKKTEHALREELAKKYGIA